MRTAERSESVDGVGIGRSGTTGCRSWCSGRSAAGGRCARRRTGLLDLSARCEGNHDREGSHQFIVLLEQVSRGVVIRCFLDFLDLVVLRLQQVPKVRLWWKTRSAADDKLRNDETIPSFVR